MTDHGTPEIHVVDLRDLKPMSAEQRAEFDRVCTIEATHVSRPNRTNGRDRKGSAWR